MQKYKKNRIEVSQVRFLTFFNKKGREIVFVVYFPYI
jgi:hypothetical protein